MPTDHVQSPAASQPEQVFSREGSSSERLRLAWAVLRAPAALAAAFVLRDRIDPALGTLRVIDIVSTPVAHALFFAAFAALLIAVSQAARRLGETRGYGVAVAVIAAVLIAIVALTPTPLLYAVPLIVLMATNFLPDRLCDRLFGAGRERGFLTVAAGIAELFFFRRYLLWLAAMWTGRKVAFAGPLAAALPAVLLMAAAPTSLLRMPALDSVERAFRMTPAARVIAHGDFNMIAFDATGRYLFASGHGLERLLRFDVADLDRPPLEASAATDYAQGFDYDPAAGEIYVYGIWHRELYYLDAATLRLKRTVPVAGLAPGDAWVAVDGRTDSIAIVSEADELTGSPFVVIDRTTGERLDKRDIDASTILLDRETSRLYLSFFRRRTELLAYDMARRTLAGDAPAPPQADRMVVDRRANELLLAAPMQSRVVRYDLETLAPKGHYDAMFAVRALAIDTKRNLLLTGSLATGAFAVIDLASGDTLASRYLGPWLRTIEVDEARGVAYVTGNGALYEVRYVDLD